MQIASRKRKGNGRAHLLLVSQEDTGYKGRSTRDRKIYNPLFLGVCMSHGLSDLPYAFDSLEPYIDAKTMEIHHDKHHAGYVNKLNAALEKHPELKEKNVDELLGNVVVLPEDIRKDVINNGGGHSNHSKFWLWLSPEKQECSGEIKGVIVRTFSSFSNFQKKFSEAATSQFGSGWTWLVFSHGALEILSTPNQDSPLMYGKIPLLGLDVWEHAYYLKYQNKRPDYIRAFWNVVNWKKVEELYKSAAAG